MNTLLRLAGFALLAFDLAACATVASVAPGTPETEVRARFGPPSVSSTNPDGSTRLVYATAPFGQTAQALTLRDGKVVDVRQVLTMIEFGQIRLGQDDRAAVLAHFGPPAETSRLVLNPREVWSYRMKQDDVFPILMHVQFDLNGIARELVVGPDPLYEPNDNERD